MRRVAYLYGIFFAQERLSYFVEFNIKAYNEVFLYITTNKASLSSIYHNSH